MSNDIKIVLFKITPRRSKYKRREEKWTFDVSKTTLELTQ